MKEKRSSEVDGTIINGFKGVLGSTVNEGVLDVRRAGSDGAVALRSGVEFRWRKDISHPPTLTEG